MIQVKKLIQSMSIKIIKGFTINLFQNNIFYGDDDEFYSILSIFEKGNPLENC